jgi:hypothetical protein
MGAGLEEKYKSKTDSARVVHLEDCMRNVLARYNVKGISEGIVRTIAARTHTFERGAVAHSSATRPVCQGHTAAESKGAGAIDAIPLSIVKNAHNRY